MGDELIVSGGGSIAIASEELLRQAERLGAVAEELRVIVDRLGMLRAGIIGLEAAEHCERAAAMLLRGQHEGERMARSLGRAFVRYGRDEALREHLLQVLAANTGVAAGLMLPVVLPQTLVALPGVLGGAALAAWITGRGPKSLDAEGWGAWLRQNNELLTNPTTVGLLRAGVMSSDDFLGGLLKLPPPLVEALGDEGLGLSGPDSAAALIMLLGGGTGLLRESEVRVFPSAPSLAAAPSGIAARADRIPRPALAPRGEQIRIDRYRQKDRPDRFEVYIAGTVTFGAEGDEPWDMTSNLAGVAGLPGGSYRAVREAMADAGITADTPVQLTGYSQGGLVAARIAASGDYEVRGLLTLGAPAGQVEVPSEVPILTLRHSEDIVPALGGGDRNPGALVVERAVFAGQEVPSDTAVPAHDLDRYTRTAELVDQATSQRLRDRADSFAAFGEGASEVQSVLYLAERERQEPKPTSGGR